MSLFMKKTSFFILVSGLIISFVLLVTPLLTAESNYATETIPFTPSFTKTICNPTNFCEDYIVYCNNESFLNLEATGYTFQFPENWQDSRNDKTKNADC